MLKNAKLKFYKFYLFLKGISISILLLNKLSSFINRAQCLKNKY